MRAFSALTQTYFDQTFSTPTPVQARAWPHIAAGEHTLLIAPTGSGKTLAAFLWCIDRLIVRRSGQSVGGHSDRAAPGVRVLYVSPLKALVYDIERNLRAPLAGIAELAERTHQTCAIPRVDVRTGDTPVRARRRQARKPAEILVTTPESLYLLLNSQARATLRTVETVIVDEVHALAGNKRGAHLLLSLERMAHSCARDPQRIGLSATARPLADIARYLGGERAVTIVDTSARPAVDLQIVVPVDDMARPESPAPRATRPESPGNPTRPGIWPWLQDQLVRQIRNHDSTIVFVNSRGLCERLTHELNELAGEELVSAHHGSLSHKQRRHIESRLQAGELAAVVATSSLELGIDMRAVQLVALVESPGSVASGLQRVGRAGHGVGQVSKGRLYPKHRGDLLMATVVAAAMSAGDIEAIRVPENPLDVLAQQIVAAVAMDDWHVDELAALIRRAASFRDLPGSALVAVLDMLAGRYPSTSFAELTPRIVWDRATDRLSARRGAKMIAILSGGTIPDRGTYGVFLAPSGPRVGELDEEMVHETRAGDLITLGASTWRVREIERDRVLVTPAPGEVGKLPFWHGDRLGRSVDLGRRIGELVRRVDARLHEHSDDEPVEHGAGQRADALASWLADAYHLDSKAADNLCLYIAEQRAATGTVPTERRITIERYRDELGDYRVCILSHLGARVHAPWALAIQARLSERAGFAIQIMWTDNGIVLRMPDGEDRLASGLLDIGTFVPDADEVEDLVVEQLAHSALFAGHFRENAARALLMPRRRPGRRTPLWVQRMKARELLAAAREFADFPIIIETYRSCLRDALDVPALIDMCRAVARREIAVDMVETRSPSPFARSLVFAYVASYLYDGDAPAAERRVQALALDRGMLRELLGEDDLRTLLDGDVIARVQAELQAQTDARRVSHADGLHDALRRLGDLSDPEIAARAVGDHRAMVQTLADSGRALCVSIAGQTRWIAVEDASLYRDALQVQLPAGIPASLLAERPRSVEELFARFARTHGPFTVAQLCQRFALQPALVEPVLALLHGRGALERGEFLPDGQGEEWCHRDVLRRIRRRTLADLRARVAPVPAAVLGRFAPAWHQLGAGACGRGALEQAIVQLEGLPVSFAELERVILPARVANYTPAMLDELGAIGWLTWIGHGALGARDGRIALYRRERVASLLPQDLQADLRAGGGEQSDTEEARASAPPSGGMEPLKRAVLEHLTTRGASFFVGLQAACAPASTGDILAALWHLVWGGMVTNDTFQALRAYGRTGASAPDAGSRRAGRRRGRRTPLAVATGRWSATRALCEPAPGATERAHARAIALLQRHGIVSAEVSQVESLTGGFSAIYPVLSAMEEAGQLRRGYFVEGIGGIQFAYPGAVERLRILAEASATSGDAPAVVVLSAVDPANPYGWLLPWPSRSGASERSPRRVAGASLVMVDGRPVLYLGKGARSLMTLAAADEPERLAAAIGGLDEIASKRRGKSLRIATIDGIKALRSPWLPAFRNAGYALEPNGLVRDLRALRS